MILVYVVVLLATQWLLTEINKLQYQRDKENSPIVCITVCLYLVALALCVLLHCRAKQVGMI